MSKQVELLRASTFDKVVVAPGVKQSQVHSIQAVQKPWSNRMKDVLVDTQRQMPTMQNKTEVVNPVRTSQVQYIDAIVKGPSDHAEAGADDAEDAERTKGKPRIPVYLNRPSPQGSPSAQRSTSRVQTKKILTRNSREQHPRKRCQTR